MTTRQMIEAMAAKGYWASPGGKTPHATLYSAILRELQNKGEKARFVKVERGQFAVRTPAAASAKKTVKSTGKKTSKKTDNSKPADGTPGPNSVSELFTI